MSIIINKSNFNEMVEKFIKGCSKANNYNSECFGMMEINRACAMNYVLEQMIVRAIKAGYSSKIFNNIINKYEMSYESKEDNGLKKELDDSFIVDMSEFKQAYSYACSIYSN